MLRAAADHRGTAFVEIYQNCPIFNDDAFVPLNEPGDPGRHADPAGSTASRSGSAPSSGKGLRFGRTGSLEAVDVAGADPDSLLVHDAHTPDPSYAFALSRLDTADFAHTPIGVFRQAPRPSYDDLMAEQIADARARQGQGDLAALLAGGTPGKSANRHQLTPNPMTVRVEHRGPVTTVILDRPQVRNAVDLPTATALAAAFAEFEADRAAPAWRCCAARAGRSAPGPTSRPSAARTATGSTPDGDGPMGPTRMRLSKPVIAAIAGHAVAGGLELALWCDLRVAEEDAVLGVFCRRWGVPLIDGGTVRLPRLIGLGRALDLILTGRAVPAAEALQMGLVSRVVPHGQARAAAEALAARARRAAADLPAQ